MKICDEDKCTGCSLCVSVCPKDAIKLTYNENGFLYPEIDKDKCINCNMCTKVCDELNSYMNTDEHKNIFSKSYACKMKDENKRMQSQSGGLFAALAETIIEKNGVVYGAGFDENNHVKHFRVDNMNDLDKLKGSKYVQSDINNSYKKVIEDLNQDKIVLFSGTPCQIAGINTLLNFKKVRKDNFYSCDFICHGVPSPKVFEAYLAYLEKDTGRIIKEFNFRDKNKCGWRNHLETYSFDSGDSRSDKKIVSNVYTELFYSNLSLRRSCKSCPYTSKNRAGDLTMGDCWGIEKTNPDLWNDNKGISICLIQTRQGENLFKLAQHKLDIYEIDSSLYCQPNLEHSSRVPYQSKNFWKDFKKMNFKKLMKKYTVYGGLRFRIKRKILKIINRW